MPAQPTRLKLAVIVGDTITGNSRAQKVAVSAILAGWNVILIGRSTSDEIERVAYGPARAVRVPVKPLLAAAENQRRRSADMWVPQAGPPRPRALDTARAVHQSRTRARTERISRLSSGAAPRAALNAWNVALHKGFTARVRVHEWAHRHRAAPDLPVGDWRRDHPQLLDLDLALGPVIERFRPDVIHAHGISTTLAAATSAGRLRVAGHQVRWLYDADTYLDGVEWSNPRIASAIRQLEREIIHRADAVATVSLEMAQLIKSEHRLTDVPLVVRNLPARWAIGKDSGSVRVAAGVSDDVPLLVHLGHGDSALDVGSAVETLPLLPDFHLAIVSNETNAVRRMVRRAAAAHGVGRRVHVVPSVDQHDLAEYLSSADLGLIMSGATIADETAVPIMVAECLHARLPVVISDLPTLSVLIRDSQAGETFSSGDARSLRDAVTRAMSRRQALSANLSEALLEEFSWEHQVTALLDLYAQLAGGAPKPQRHPRPENGWDLRERPRTISERGKKPRSSSLPRRWRQLTQTPIRLGLGPANFAGQLAAMARAVTDVRTDVSAEVFMNVADVGFGYPADVYIPTKTLRRLDTQLEQVRRIVPHYTHLIADAFYPVFGKLNGDDISGDLPILRRINVALLAHGTEIRHPRRHMDRVPHSLFRDAPDTGFIEARVLVTERNRRIADETGLAAFVTTPDLLVDLPQAIWLPLIVEVDAWATDCPLMERDRPKVLHAPSKRWTKGTDRFIAQLQALHSKGAIELQVVEGVKWRAMRKLVQDADIVVDQFSVGAYGTFACEAMAAGKPVLAFLTEQVVGVIGETPPIVNTSLEGVGATIERLVQNRAEAIRLGNEAASYVRKYHDGRETVRRLSTFLASR